MTESTVDTQVIANLVVRNPGGEVLFVRYDPDSEKWWLPGQDVAPFAHPDAAAAEVAGAIGLSDVKSCRFSHFDSFRGRRGWHIVFHYDVRASGEASGPHEARWYAAGAFPRTAHGGWEKQVIEDVRGGGKGAEESATD